MTAIALCIAAALSYPPASAVRACRLAPWAVEGAAEARTWTREQVTPAVMLAVASVETGGTFKTPIVGGWKGAYCSPWQVAPKWAGMTCAELQGQPGAMAAGRILGRFARRGKGLVYALNSYGGDSSGEYARRVMAALRGFQW